VLKLVCHNCLNMILECNTVGSTKMQCKDSEQVNGCMGFSPVRDSGTGTKYKYQQQAEPITMPTSSDDATRLLTKHAFHSVLATYRTLRRNCGPGQDRSAAVSHIRSHMYEVGTADWGGHHKDMCNCRST
jgi:hypothetical protein